MATTELVFRIRTDSADFKSTMAQVRSELKQTQQTQTTVAKSELSSRQQIAAAQSLQRQRSAALISEWKKAETAARNAAAGTTSFKDVLDGLSRSVATMQGPLGGVAGRFSSIGSLFTELTSTGAGVAVGLGAIAAAAAGAAVAVFKLTVQTAEFQGKMFDLSQQVGVSVETLSALEVAAQTSGASIEAITQSIFIFQQKLEDAQDPTSKQAKLFKELGVETNNTEQAFRQTLAALAAMPVGFEQSDKAAQLFGSRGGKQMLGVLKEMDGDLDGAIEKLRQMGALITTDTAKAADKFNDQLAVLGFQIRALTGIIGNEAMPEISEALKTVSELLIKNQGVIREWTSEIGDATRGAFLVADGIIAISNAITGLNNIPVPLVLRILAAPTGIEGILRGLSSIGDQGPFAGVTGGIGSTARGGGVRRTAGGGGKGRTARDNSLRDATRNAALAEREALLITETDITENKRALQEQARTIEEFTRRAIELDQLQLEAKIDRISAESNALEEALAKRLIKQDEYENKQRDLDIDAAKAHQENRDEVFRLEREKNLEISNARIAAKQREEQILDDADQRQIERTENKVEQGVLTEAEGERRIAAILDQGFQRRKDLLEEEAEAYSTSLERRKDITAELIRLDGERVASAEDAARRIFEAENEKARGATRNRRAAIDNPELTGGIDQLFEAIDKDLTGNTQTAALAGLQALTSAFEGVGQAVGQAAAAWVLYGKAGTSVRKVTAEILASIAQQAAIKSVFEFAEGLAALALAFFGLPNAGPSASAHFAASAMYAGIAGVAAIAGRAIAGNSFTQGGGGEAGAPTAAGEPERDRTIREGRPGGGRDPNTPQETNVNITLRLDSEVLERQNVKIFRKNGAFRSTLRSDLLGEPTG